MRLRKKDTHTTPYLILTHNKIQLYSNKVFYQPIRLISAQNL